VGVVIDFEVSNRCNAKCHFCPRDQTPHQGSMPPDVFEQGLVRAKEYRDIAKAGLGVDTSISLCGLGEPLLNRNVVDYVRRAKAEGFHVQMSSNAALLTEEKAIALLDAGLDEILINAGDEGDDYDEVYGLPWQRTYDNVVRFQELAEGRCSVSIVLVDHRESPEHAQRMRELWGAHGIKSFYSFAIMNRGGALSVDHMQYEQMPQLATARELLGSEGTTPRCGAPFAYLFIGYDAQYYLCCSDWRKETSMGSIFDRSFADVVADKIRMITTREPACRSCNLDPINQLTGELRAHEAGLVDETAVEAMAASIIAGSHALDRGIAALGFGDVDIAAAPAASPASGRKLIPVRAD
jgi:MoaA/NifB/PqqE/SkfB family radical SAM enzyme